MTNLDKQTRKAAKQAYERFGKIVQKVTGTKPRKWEELPGEEQVTLAQSFLIVADALAQWEQQSLSEAQQLEQIKKLLLQEAIAQEVEKEKP